MDALANLDKARLALMEARTLPEVKKIRDLAQAARVYARAAHLSKESLQYAAEIEFLAELKAGGILNQLERSKGGRPGKTAAPLAAVSEYKKVLVETKTPDRIGRKWQQAASVPEKTKEQYIENAKAEEKQLSRAGLMSFHKENGTGNGTAPKMIDEAQRYRNLKSAVDSIYKNVPQPERKEEIHRAANKLLEAY